MIKITLLTVSLLVAIYCIVKLRRSTKELSRAAEVPQDAFGDIEKPRYELLKMIAFLREENESLRSELEQIKTKSRKDMS